MKLSYLSKNIQEYRSVPSLSCFMNESGRNTIKRNTFIGLITVKL